MDNLSSEETVQKLEQEITLYLQRIDSNFSYCFNKITQDIVPHVREYGVICDNIMDSSSWLLNMFQQTGNVDLNNVDENSAQKMKGELTRPTDTLFPSNNSTGNLNTNSGVIMVPSMPKVNNNKRINDSFTEDFHTADITSTGRILKVPDSSDEEDGDDAQEDGDESTIQRQRRKRKVSLLLQQEYASSSTMASPFVPSKSKRTNFSPSRNDEQNTSMNSSPMKESISEDESTKEVPKPGTVIHFTTS